MSIKIDKNIPIPRKRSGRPRKYPNLGVVLSEMEVGDSVVFPVDHKGHKGTLKSREAEAFRAMSHTEGFKTVTRLSEDRKTIRVWRTA